MEVGSVVDEDERGRLGKCTAGVPGVLAPPRAQGGGRPALSGGAAFLHGGERALAGAPQGVWPLEQRVDAVRPFEQGRRVRGLLRHAGSDEPVSAPDPDV